MGNEGKNDENDLNNNSEQMVQAFALLRVSSSQFSPMPERIEFNGTPCISGYMTLHKDTISDLHIKVRSSISNPMLSYSFRSDRQWRLQQIQDAGNSIELASVYAQNGAKYAKKALSILQKGINRVNCPLPLAISALHDAQFSRMFSPALPSDCLSNLFIHENDVILSLYFIQSTNKPAHPNIRRLYYPAGTVFEIGSRRMEIYAVHHARATIQWLKASKDNSVQAEMLLKNIYVN